MVELSRVDLSKISERELVARHLQPRVPFIGYGAGLPTTDLQHFLRTHGSKCVRSSSNAFFQSSAKHPVRLRDYHRRFAGKTLVLDPDRTPPAAVFHDLLGNAHLRHPGPKARRPWEVRALPALQAAYPTPRFIVNLSQRYPADAVWLAFGPMGAYSALHTHGDAFCYLTMGEKAWCLYPNALTLRVDRLLRSLKVKSPQAYWLKHIAPLSERSSGDVTKPLASLFRDLMRRGLADDSCVSALQGSLSAAELRGVRGVQRAGEFVYVPSHWGHQAVNGAWALALIVELTPRPRSDG